MKFIENQTFDRERALYGERNLHLKRCTFDGPADGESALKECCGIQVEDCLCNLRYPLERGILNEQECFGDINQPPQEW